jgi:hypothetical protein
MATTLHTAAEAVIDAPAPTVLAVLRDFNGRHREILPPAFSNRVEEPAEGLIEEHIVGRDMVTTFTVRPHGDRALARIETRWQSASGLAGLLERLAAPRMLRQIYREELARLDRVAASINIESTEGTVAP